MFLAVVIPALGDARADERAAKFVKRYCLDCHGPETQKGDRRFDELFANAVDQDAMFDIQDIIDQLTLEEMPPEEAEQPSAAARQAVIDSLTSELADARQRQQSSGGEVVLRRMNRREYLNTIGDLLRLDMTTFDPTTRFPRDNRVDYLDNIGSALTTSGYLLEQYLEAADQVIEKVFADNEQPQLQTWEFKGHFRQQPELNPAHDEAFDYRYLCLYDCPQAERPEGAYGPLEDFHEGVPHDGRYEISVLAHAVNRDTPYDAELLKIDLDEPFRLGIVPGDGRVGELHTMQPIQPLLAETEIADGDPQWYRFEVPLDRHYTPRFTFQNGMQEVRPTYARIMRKYRASLPERSRGAKGIFRERKALIKDGLLPHIRIHEVRVRGPLDRQWPTASQQSILGDQPFAPARVRELLTEFAARAYRRPAREDEVARLLALYEARIETGQPEFAAFKDALKAVLCSPAFLYLQPMDTAADRLAGYPLAARLSYFLWSSMPDEPLRALAAAGKLNRPDVLRNEVRRMLAGDKSAAFVSGFLDSWLNLVALGDMPPDRKSFSEYYSRGLEGAMRRETQMFTRYMIDENRPLVDYLAADYAFINRDLAKLYDQADLVPVANGYVHRQVALSDPIRGGLLGQASVLTVTANGIETSPVLRGVWLLENILGTPPAPPPDDVPAIDPDVRGATTIRELLAKHRDTAACNECHRKIDPLGFALESFDPIGGWRDEYDNGARIDTSGELPSGQSFTDVVGLKQVLEERLPFFARMLTEKLAAYGTGRRIEPADRQAIDAILEQVAADGYPLRSLIEELVVSELFHDP